MNLNTVKFNQLKKKFLNVNDSSVTLNTELAFWSTFTIFCVELIIFQQRLYIWSCKINKISSFRICHIEFLGDGSRWWLWEASRRPPTQPRHPGGPEICQGPAGEEVVTTFLGNTRVCRATEAQGRNGWCGGWCSGSEKEEIAVCDEGLLSITCSQFVSYKSSLFIYWIFWLRDYALACNYLILASYFEGTGFLIHLTGFSCWTLSGSHLRRMW